MYNPSQLRQSIDCGDFNPNALSDANVNREIDPSGSSVAPQNWHADRMSNVDSSNKKSLKMDEPVTRKPFRILALDGGGARGLMQAIIIGRILKEFPSFLQDVDMISGTSAGSLNAAYLAMGNSPDALVKIWESNAQVVFTQTWWQKVKSGFGLIGPSYDNAPLISMITSFAGNTTLSQIPKKILIPSFNLDPNDDITLSRNSSHSVQKNYEGKNMRSADSSGASISGISTSGNFYSPAFQLNNSKEIKKNSSDLEKQNLLKRVAERRWFPEYFHNFDHSPNSQITIVNACVRSAAAPTYFPIFQGFVDGGVFANNPSLSAISSSICEGIDLEDVIVFSLSTGNNPQFVGPSQYGNGRWGIYSWGLKLIDLLMDSTSISATHQSAALLGDRFFRLDPLLPHEIDLADASPNAILLMQQLAESLDLSPVIDWLKKYWHIKK
eukprot:TRINITY_DN2564_c0_g1_i1.p1 TRINITY_DN2564_c0_g1~~TRINITY_DN2564_c0_g1_i1.p1  ORF type:complete len:440 (+),score=159.69 TRINITY_DN2564_c0_g1_i1:62-1381(+)